jgi:hypothetical protein
MALQEEKRTSIIGAELQKGSFGSDRFHATSRRSLFSSKGVAYKLGECGPTYKGNQDTVVSQLYGRHQDGFN